MEQLIFRRFLARHLDKLSTDNIVRVIILRGKGKHFCSGIDLNLLSGTDPTAPKLNVMGQDFRYMLTTILQPLLAKMTLIEKPIVAVIQEGLCWGSGFELALACDFRITHSQASFQMLESRLGIIPDLGGTTRLLRLVNPSSAKEIVLAARNIDGKRAEKMGFVNYFGKSTEEVEDKTNSLVKDLLLSAPLAVGMGKRLIDMIYGQPESLGLQQEGATNAVLFKTKDFLNAIDSFKKRVPPKWSGE